MLLDQIFDKFEPVKWIYVRKNGKLKKIRKTVSEEKAVKQSVTPMFPISKDTK